MLVKDLIAKLMKLPQDATIGTVDVADGQVHKSVSIVTNKDTLYDSFIGEEITIKQIEESRHSNRDRICDFYIV